MILDEPAELEMHLAAGTDLPTALASLPTDSRLRESSQSWLPLIGLVAGLIAAVVIWWLLR